MYPDFQDLVPDTLPKPADLAKAEMNMERWLDNLSIDKTVPTNVQSWLETPHFSNFMQAIFGCSPFLGSLLIRDHGFSIKLFEQGPDACFKDIIENLKSLTKTPPKEAEVSKALRIAKRNAALLIAIADIASLWPLEKITDAISDLADHCLQVTTAFILLALHERGDLELPYPNDPNRESGFFILGMGKLGSRELNYSSDVDIIILYDLEKIKSKDHNALRQSFVRATRDLMRIMDSRTADGYVFRTDLRLRPDPGATPLAMSYMAAVTYYESLGQNWERAAMIKARVVAGDVELGNSFIEEIRPFVWRKSLDFAMIEDIHSIKRQIHAHKGGGKVAILNHNIKIGRGGIREIEFFAQTQQLIWGGRQMEMRVKDTCAALDALYELGHIEGAVRDDLNKAYHFLRTLEHRLQMIEDKQTQTMPSDEEGLEALAFFMGYQSKEELSKILRSNLETVENHYAKLFEESHDLGGEHGSLVFTGAEDDPETLDNLNSMGYKQPERTCSIIRSWHRGRYRATRSERARQILTELLPTILEFFAKTADPDEAFIRFDTFLEGLPSGVQIFSLFQINPQLLELLAEIMGEVPQSAGWLARRPNLLESVLSSDFFEPVDDKKVMQSQLSQMLAQARDYQDVLDITRRWTNDYKFRISVHIMRHLNEGKGISLALSNVAEVAINGLIPEVEKEFAAAHGIFKTGRFGILGFGKLGGLELLPGSDLDLVFLYDTGDEAESDGPRPLSPSLYYTRLCQRISTAINAQSAEGRLYEVDARLRPDGNAGGVATQFKTFNQYYQITKEEGKSKAWTWEHMALTRARVIYATNGFDDDINASIIHAKIQTKSAELVRKDIFDMRERISKQFPSDQRWVIKHYRGGLVDVEFVAQYLQLIHGSTHPEIFSTNTEDCFRKAENAGLLDSETMTTLITGLNLWRNIQAVLRLTGAKVGKIDDEVRSRQQLLLRVCDFHDFEELSQYIDQQAELCFKIFQSFIFSSK